LIRNIFILLFALLLGANVASAQTEKDRALAAQYYRNGDYDKAAELYDKLFQKEGGTEIYYKLFDCYSRLKQFEVLEKFVGKQVKRNKDDLRYQVDLGLVYKLEAKQDKANTTWDGVIKALQADEAQIRQIAAAFESYQQDEYQLKTFERGAKLLKDRNIFGFDIAEMYFKKKDAEKGINYLLDFINDQPGMVQGVYNYLQSDQNGAAVMDQLETQLYARIQKQPNNEVYPEMLIWLLIQRKDFESAFIQVKAIDKRKNEDGDRIMNFAVQATTEQFYDEAIKAYEYVISKGKDRPYFLMARSLLLRVRKEKLAKGLHYTTEDLLALKGMYQDFINTYGVNPTTAPTVIDLAELEALYLGNLDTAIAELQRVISLPGLTRMIRNTAKLNEGDYQVMNGDYWESSLLYSQVDKEEKDGALGEDARFRNARLAYYKGEFEWSQAQLDVLKGSTSELIANDALQLSIFIMDNSGLDSTTEALEMYSSADLLIFQHKYKEAQTKLDSIPIKFPAHSLTDDIWMAEARIAINQQQFDKAIDLLQKILAGYKTGILGDDATYMLAGIYEKQLHDKDKAMELYKDIMMNYKSSIYLTEARKKFRALRGDKLDEEN